MDQQRKNDNDPRSNIVWHEARVSAADRAQCLRQCGCVLWLTGLSGCGKSTLARALEERLIRGGHAAYVLDGDNIRHGLNQGLGFSPEDRRENIRRIAHVSALFADAGLVTLTAFISPYRAERELARSLVPAGRFYEVWLDVPLEVCEARDPKKLYRKARRGEIADFTGISAPYEAPERPEIVINTASYDIEQSVDILMKRLEQDGILNPGQES